MSPANGSAFSVKRPIPFLNTMLEKILAVHATSCVGISSWIQELGSELVELELAEEPNKRTSAMGFIMKRPNNSKP